MSEKSLRLLEVRFLWAVVGLPAKKNKVKTRLGPERPAETTELQMRHLWTEEKVESQKRKGTRESTRREPEN